MTALLERVRAWSCRRQHLGGAPAAADPASALAGVVAVYSSHPSAPLSLAARVPGFAPGDLAELEAGRAAVRVPAMRGSSHLVPLPVAPAALALARPSPAARAYRRRQGGLEEAREAELRAGVLALAREPRSRAELREALHTDTAAMDAVVVGLARDGLVLRLAAGSLRANTLRYVATDAWLGAPLETLDRAEAARRLAPLYLRAFGPARAADFAWWTGLPRATTDAALAALELEDVGEGLLLPAEDRDAFATTRPLSPDRLDVLPLWDAYTMAYAADGRARLARPEHLGRLYDSVGNANGAVLVGGRAMAAWGSRFAGARLEVRLNAFGPLPRAEVAARFGALARLLGGTDATLVDTDELLQPAGGKVRVRAAAPRSPGNGP